MPDSTKMVGFLVLFIGVGVLIFTFYNAYQYLLAASITSPSGDLIGAFTGALTPLIATCMKAIYLGVMGWVGGLITRRGVQVIVGERGEKAEGKKGAEPESKEEQKKG